MSVITIKGKEVSYDENEIITFAEGLIGMPEMRRAVLVPMDEFEPFCWLASVESEKARFIVVDPHEVFAGYEPFPAEQSVQTFAIVKISSDWQKTTVNLRAPLVINTETQIGAQLILSDSKYQFAESLMQT
ncbi:MAG: flagellar assembly protein FliW [Pyrinomonadaceae bacterium]